MQVSQYISRGKNVLLWDKIEKAHHYRIMAMTQTFVYMSIVTTQKNRYEQEIYKNNPFLRFKVIAESEDNNKIAESNEVFALYQNIENFNITALYGYNWTTIAFRSKGVYDLYKVYDKDNLIAETEDPILELSYKITKKELNCIIVEWYTKVEDKYVLWGISEGIAKLPERKKADYKISVVIPIYNVQNFLPRALDSVLSSSMPDIELILVDDWSIDDSPKICDWYAKHFPCVSVIHQHNQWVCFARNNGINIAKGEYLGIPDSDDIIHPFMYEILYNTCKIENTDVAIATTIIRNDINNKEYVLSMPGKKEDIIVYTYDEVMKNKHNENNMYYVSTCNKIIKRQIATQVKFPTEYPNRVILYEDSAYTASLYSYVDSFALCKNAYYIYDKRNQSTIGSSSTMYNNESNENVRKAFIYAYSYPMYNRCEKNKELSDYTNFKRLIESYDKFDTPSPLLDYRNEKLKELVDNQKLIHNKYISEDYHLREIINKLKNMTL